MNSQTHKRLVLLLLVPIIMLTSCNSCPNAPTKTKTMPEINLMDRVESITDSVDVIDEKAETMSDAAPNTVADIKAETGKLLQTAKSLVVDSANFDVHKDYISELETSIHAFEDKVLKLKDEDRKFFKKIMYSVLSIAGIMMVAGVMATLYGRGSLGIPLVIGSIVLTAMAYALIEYLAYVCGFGAFLVFGALVYYVYKTVHHERALNETVEAFEIAKNGDWNNVRGIVKLTQSKKTKDIVSKIKTHKVNK